MKSEDSDPTRSGFSAPQTGVAQLSGGEVRDLCLKAARGAGFSWGLAEEAGYTARWLCERGLDGPRALLEHLLTGGADWPSAHLRDGALHVAEGEKLSPIVAGSVVSDVAPITSETIHAERVHKPLLLLPFIHLAADATTGNAALTWESGCVTVSGAGQVLGDLDELIATEIADVSVVFSKAAIGVEFKAEPPLVLSHETIAKLNLLAMETTVPATDASRADAGSSDGDND